MKRPGLFEGIGFALAASLAGGICFVAMRTIVPPDLVLRALVCGLGFAYGCYLLVRSSARIGRITAAAAWLVLSVVSFVAGFGLPVLLLAQLTMVWLSRSLFYYSSVVSALADLALSGFSALALVWAASSSGDIFLSIWTIFLVQALFTAIPGQWTRSHAAGPRTTGWRPGSSRAPGKADTAERFERAHRAGEAALRDLLAAR